MSMSFHPYTRLPHEIRQMIYAEYLALHMSPDEVTLLDHLDPTATGEKGIILNRDRLLVFTPTTLQFGPPMPYVFPNQIHTDPAPSEQYSRLSAWETELPICHFPVDRTLTLGQHVCPSESSDDGPVICPRLDILLPEILATFPDLCSLRINIEILWRVHFPNAQSPTPKGSVLKPLIQSLYQTCRAVPMGLDLKLHFHHNYSDRLASSQCGFWLLMHRLQDRALSDGLLGFESSRGKFPHPVPRKGCYRWRAGARAKNKPDAQGEDEEENVVSSEEDVLEFFSQP